MIRIRFINPTTLVAYADTEIEGVTITFRLSETEDWSAEIPANSPTTQSLQVSDIVEMYDDGELIFTGVLQSFDRKFTGNKISYGLKGRGIIDELYATRAFSQAYYENKNIILVLAELLRRAGWRLGNVSTLTDKTLMMTIDLRSEKRLLNQVLRTLEGIPATFHRYGGFIVGKHSLDVGGFNQQSDLALIRPADGDGVNAFDTNNKFIGESTGAVSSISVKTSNTEIINSIEAVGGEIKDNTGVRRLVTLGDALTANPSLASDPDFPISALGGGMWIVRNNSVPVTVGSQTTEQFSQYAPERTENNSTLAAIQNAALAMYQRCVAFLKDNAGSVNDYDIDAEGVKLFSNVGDSIYVYGSYTSTMFDQFSQSETQLVETVDENLRLTSYKVDYKDDKVSWNFTLTNGDRAKQEDLIVSLYDEAKTRGQVAGLAVAPAFVPQIATIDTVVSPANPNTTLNDGTPALQITHTLGAPPGGSTQAYLGCLPYTIAASNSNMIIELVSDPAHPSTPAVCKIAVKNRGWVYGDTATVRFSVIYY